MNDYLQFALSVAEDASNVLLNYFGNTDISRRATPKEIKTHYDTAADEIIIKRIEQQYPDHSYITEETGRVIKGDEFLWIIDPLDGTGNFVNNNPFFAVSIALWKNQQPYLSVIAAPHFNEQYVAVKDEGSYIIKNGEQIECSVSTVSDLSQSYCVYCEGGSDDKQKVLTMISEIYQSVKGMRILGSAAMELAWVGLGRCEAYFTPQISLWDIAAGILFVEESGGKITDFSGKPYTSVELLSLEGINLLATNGHISVPSIPY